MPKTTKMMKQILFIITVVLSITLPAAVHGEGAKLKFDSTLYDFELINENGGCVSHDFTFTNIGDAPLVIIDINTNCGCTTAQYPQAPISPGEQGIIEITFDPKGNPGEFAKEIIVKSNAHKKRTKLHIKGMVIPQQ